MENGAWWSGKRENIEKSIQEVPEFCLLNDEKIEPTVWRKIYRSCKREVLSKVRKESV